MNPPRNPALSPRRALTVPPRFRGPIATDTLGLGPKRAYPEIQRDPKNVAYPPRPIPGSVADMDVIMDNCDFQTDKVCSRVTVP
jgi:DDB1- and CUL4-associated factor 13